MRAIPRRTIYRRRIQENSVKENDAISEIVYPVDSREITDSMMDSVTSDSCESMDFENLSEDEVCSATKMTEEVNDPLHFENNFGVEDPFSPLYKSADISNYEAFLSILSFCVRFHLSGVCVEELLRLLKLLLPPCSIPGTKYLLNKAIKSSTGDKSYKIHLYCANCNNYISEMEKSNEEVLCTLCEKRNYHLSS
ncbi:uncharacterized protein [Parasteatoda tepidariorum]|uniref:uncharacterized protein n=1 Tax=Parasteatoda tepidariorum TaxID=114398 RepID=UPI0039BD5DCC